MINPNLNYQVGQQVYADKFQAASEAWRTKQEVHFNLFDTVFDRTDWSQEPKLSWDQLLDMRAAQIASKNRPIVLHFSGGTDSYTIYRVFERNRIHLSALIFNFRDDPEYQSMYSMVHKFLQQGIYDPHCQIIFDNYDRSDTFDTLYNDSDWSWTTQERHSFAFYSGLGNGDEVLCERFGKEVISVLGTDKPRLRFAEDGVYSYQDDHPWLRHIKNSRLESFYITDELPELHVKQSWMLKRHLQHKYVIDKSCADLIWLSAQSDPNKFDWQEYAAACGRFGDLANSQLQHVGNTGIRMYIPPSGSIQDAVYTGRAKKIFDKLKSTDTLGHFVTGLLAAATDGAGQYLGLNTDNLLYVRSLYSKGHRMPW